MKATFVAGASLIGALLALSVAWTPSQALNSRQPLPSLPPAQGTETVQFDVTVTNLTAGQVFSPLFMATHDVNTSILTLGQPASAELATLAEDGDAAPLAALLMGDAGVEDVQLGLAPIPPGASDTIRVTASSDKRQLSLAAMLVNTNDAFVALEGGTLPLGGHMRAYLVAYDAGSEANNEDCGFIPGPACMGMGAGVRDTAGAEGFVHVHSGVHGIQDLDAATLTWGNPVALVTVTRVP